MGESDSSTIPCRFIEPRELEKNLGRTIILYRFFDKKGNFEDEQGRPYHVRSGFIDYSDFSSSGFQLTSDYHGKSLPIEDGDGILMHGKAYVFVDGND